MLQLREATACSLPINITNSWDRVSAGNAALALSCSIQQECSRSRSYFPRDTVLAQSLLQRPPSSSMKLVMVSRKVRVRAAHSSMGLSETVLHSHQASGKQPFLHEDMATVF